MGVTLLWAIKMRCTECPFNQWFISQIMVNTLNWFLVPSNKPLSNQILQWKKWFCLKFHVTDRLTDWLYCMCSVLFNFLKVGLICTKQNLQNILCRLPSLFIHNKQTQLGVLSKNCKLSFNTIVSCSRPARCWVGSNWSQTQGSSSYFHTKSDQCLDSAILVGGS